MGTTTPPRAGNASALIELAEVWRPLISAMITMELLTIVALYVVSVYVVRVMCTTSILHLNLRLLFVWQCVASMVFGVGKGYRDVVNLLIPITSFPYRGSAIDLFLVRVGIHANVYVTPLMVVERICATRAVDSYESWRGGHYRLYALMVLMLMGSVYSAAKETSSLVVKRRAFDPTAATLNLVNITGGAIACLILLCILRHNERIYREGLHSRKGHSLSERYQRSENIRATRQLLPVTLLHVLQTTPTSVFIFLAYTRVMDTPLDYVIYANAITLAIALFSLALQITIITSHPILRREAIGKFRRLLYTWFGEGCCETGGNRVSRFNSKAFNIAIIYDAEKKLQPNTFALKTMDGHELIPHIENKYEEHFKNLADYWEMNSPPSRQTSTVLISEQHSPWPISKGYNKCPSHVLRAVANSHASSHILEESKTP